MKLVLSVMASAQNQIANATEKKDGDKEMITLQQITDIMQQAGFGGPEQSIGRCEFRSLSSSAKISFFYNGPNWAVMIPHCYMLFDDMRLENDFLMFDRDGGHAGNIWTAALNGFNVGDTN